jgi:hypothetical protein
VDGDLLPQFVEDFVYIKNLRFYLAYVDDLVTFVRTVKLPNNVSFLPGRREYCTGNSCVGNLTNRDGGRNEKIETYKLQDTPYITF